MGEEATSTDSGLTLTIRLDPAAGPISGVLVAGGSPRPFSGWIQLAALIDSLRPLPDAGQGAVTEGLKSPPRSSSSPPRAPRAN